MYVNCYSRWFYRLDALPVAQPTASKHCSKSFYILTLKTVITQSGKFNVEFSLDMHLNVLSMNSKNYIDNIL